MYIKKSAKNSAIFDEKLRLENGANGANGAKECIV